MKINILVIIFCALTSLQLLATTVANIGTLHRFQGEVMVISAAGAKSKAQADHQLTIGDGLETAERSFAKVKLIDGSILVIAPNSKIKLAEFEQVQNMHKSTYQIIRGQMRAIFSKGIDKQKKSISVKTKTVSIGIRGTEILVGHQTMYNGNQVAKIALLEGEAEVTNLLNQKSYRLQPGQHVVAMVNHQDNSFNFQHSLMNQQRFKQMVAQSQVTSPSSGQNFNTDGEVRLSGTRRPDEIDPFNSFSSDMFMDMSVQQLKKDKWQKIK